MLQTIDSLEVAHDLIDSKMTSRARAAVVEARGRAASEAEEAPIEAALKKLAKAQVAFKKLDLSNCTFDIVAERIADSAREIATYFEKSQVVLSDEVVHEWRKRVQYHRRHVRLLSSAWPAALQPRIDALRTLSEQLGRDQDLAVLATFIASKKERGVAKADARELVGLCRREQAEVRNQAYALGALLAAEKPRSLRRRIAAYWAVQSERSMELKLAAE